LDHYRTGENINDAGFGRAAMFFRRRFEMHVLVLVVGLFVLYLVFLILRAIGRGLFGGGGGRMVQPNGQKGPRYNAFNDPMNPANPRSILNPMNPMNPNNPANPMNRNNPANPLNPNNPANPMNPNNPASPAYRRHHRH
jgi:hypothetical protein